MRKIRLELETLVVESFPTAADARPAAGTIMGNSEDDTVTRGDTCYVGSCEPMTCAGQDLCQLSYNIDACTTIGGATLCPTGSPWENTCGPWSYGHPCSD